MDDDDHIVLEENIIIEEEEESMNAVSHPTAWPVSVDIKTVCPFYFVCLSAELFEDFAY